MKKGRPRSESAKRRSITVRVSEDTYKRLSEYAAVRDMSLTEVTIRSLEKYLNEKSN